MIDPLTQSQNNLHEINLFEFQMKVFEDKARYRVIAAGRRTGKSFLSCIEAIHHCLTEKNRRVLIVGPTFGQAKEAVWTNIKAMIAPEWVKVAHESTLELTFINGSRISLKGADRPDTLRGISPSPTLIICDEFAFFKKGVWEEVILPQGADPIRKARFLIISTPKGIGNTFHELFLLGQENRTDWKSWQFRALDVRPDMREEIETAKNTLDIKTFNQEFGADFSNTGNSVFYPFKYNVHVHNDLPHFDRGETVHLGVDFNVAIMASAAFAVRGNQVHYIDEFQGAANTEKLCDQVNATYPNHKIVAYPDPSGKARKSSAAVGITDFSIMEQAGWEVRSTKAAPPIIDSVNCVNRMLEDANGNSNLFIHPRCKSLIQSFSGTQWSSTNLDNATIDKTGNVEHMSDHVRYAMSYLFPIKTQRSSSVRTGRMF